MMTMRHFWLKSKAITLVLCSKLPNLKLIDCDWRLNSDENEAFLAKK